MQAEGCGACWVAGQNEDAVQGEHGCKGFSTGSYEYCHCSQFPKLSPILNEQQGPDTPMWWLGDRVSLAQWLGCPQSPALQHQATWEGPHGGR